MSESVAPKATMLDQIALGVTMTFAVLSLVFWIWSALGVGGSEFAESALNVTTVVVMVGGIAMGLLYLRRRLIARSA